MKLSTHSWDDITLGFTVLFQGGMSLIAGPLTNSFMDRFFASRGFLPFFVYLFCWIALLCFLRRIMITDYSRMFHLWLVLIHIYLGMALWPSLMKSLNSFLNGAFTAQYGTVVHFSSFLALLLISWGLFIFSRKGQGL